MNSDQPLSFFENWTAKIELAINKDDYKSALVALEEVSNSICNAGYIEEYIRVSNLLFINIDWKTALNEEYSYFNSQFTKFVETLIEFGKFDDASAYLTKYEKHITNKGANYIRFCKSKGHFFWFQNRFAEAIEVAEEGVALEEQSTTKSGLDLKHTLALSLRDTKQKENISKALAIFLRGNSIENLVQDNDDQFIAGETYGNVGRCLQYNGNISDALICFKKSLKKLKDPMNKGYAFLWIAECMILNNQIDIALWFYRQAYIIWKRLSPIKANGIDKKITAIIEVNSSLIMILDRSEREVENYCNNIISTK